MGTDDPGLKWTAERVVDEGDRSGFFSDIEMMEKASDPRLVDFHLEALTGNEYFVLLREDLGEASVLFERYTFEDVPTHRIIEFIALLERGDVSLSFSRFKWWLSVEVSIPEGKWAIGRRFRKDLSEWEESIIKRH
ncbi:hypothetical protein GCM10009639_26200 [Kitasatospora putterlickiae]|uniref:Uncharacterized protein n=1 Tax=Kitasatospora putterlickiae TaxID=221725 RepID=A0ABN1XYT6_9ACTN